MTLFQKWLLGTVIGGLAVLLVCAVLITRHLLPVIDSLNASDTQTHAKETLTQADTVLGKATGLLQKLTDALPQKGKLDAIADNANGLVTDARKAVPTPKVVSGITDAATGLLGAGKKAISDTSDTLNHKCKGPSGPDACGTLPQLSKTAIKIQDAIVTTQIQEKEKVIPHTLAAVDAFKDLAQSKDVTGSIHEGYGILTDVHHATTKYLNPPPCKTKWCKTGRVMGNIGRGMVLVATGVEIKNGFDPIRVKVVK